MTADLIMKSKANTKRGRGRPKLQPKSPQELKEEARAGIQRSMERRLGRKDIDVEELCVEVSSITHRNRFTKEERDELHEKVQLLYDEFVVAKWEEEKLDECVVQTLRAVALETPQNTERKMQTPEQWADNHGLRLDGKRKPGPPKAKKKTVFDIEPGERGTAAGPSEPIDAEVFEHQWMDAQVAKQKDEDRFLKGKRLRKIPDPPRRRAEAKSFWI